jgi:release factor glutamine methyltransferase
VRLGELVREAAAQIGRLEARVLLAHVLERPASYLIAHADDLLEAGPRARFEALVARRRAGEPVAYLVGTREFYGRSFRVDQRVLIPRPETELIVDLAREAFPAGAPRVLDLGTGSGALAVTLACEWPQARVVAVDASEEALAVAQANGARLGAAVHWLRSDWFDALAAEARFELIVTNPPYVRLGDPHLAEGDVRFEPASALASGPDGLDDIRRIVAGAARFLAPAGQILIEHGYDQAAAVRPLLEAAGFGQVRSWCDLAGIERISGGRVDASAAGA